jgi:hypothetical protein
MAKKVMKALLLKRRNAPFRENKNAAQGFSRRQRFGFDR